MHRTEWFNRKFPTIEDNGMLPSIIERLTGTPAQIDEMTGGLQPSLLTLRSNEKWIH